MFNQPKNAKKRTLRHETNPSEISPAVLNHLQQRPVLSSGDILHLQRTIGNTAVQRLLQTSPTRAILIQRELADVGEYLETHQEEPGFKELIRAVGVYRKVSRSRETPEDLQACFEALQSVERALYAQFDQVSQSKRELSEDQHTEVLKELLDSAEQEYQVLVRESKEKVEVLPFDITGLDEEETAALKGLWQDIVHSNGKIKLIGSEEYNDRVLAELAHILATKTGRNLLGLLNFPTPKKKEKKSQQDLTNIYIGELVSKLPGKVREASPDLQDIQHSEAQPLNVEEASKNKKRSQTAMTGVVAHPFKGKKSRKARGYPAVTSDNLLDVRDAAWGGKKGFTNQSVRYDFNKHGVGAYVTSFPGQAFNPAKETGNEILTPGWVTLGHELGHAANMRLGAATIDYGAQLSSLTNDLAGGEQESVKWDNAEELLNIENVENPLRRESGLTERGGHQPPAWLLAKTAPLRLKWGQQLGQAANEYRPYQYPGPEEYDDWHRVYDRVSRNAKPQELLDPARVKEFDDEVERIWQPAADKLGKRPKLTLANPSGT